MVKLNEANKLAGNYKRQNVSQVDKIKILESELVKSRTQLESCLVLSLIMCLVLKSQVLTELSRAILM